MAPICGMADAIETTRRIGGLLVCPLCKGPLALGDEPAVCRNCGAVYPQSDARYLDLRPPAGSQTSDGDHASRRQMEMEEWYEELLRDPTDVVAMFVQDYSPYARILSSLEGIVVDVGGGVGIPRHFLGEGCTYVVVDPSVMWLKYEWLQLAEYFPCLRTPPMFVRGVGEHLPFADGSVDVVLGFWSLNHVTDPGRVVAEIGRVLRPSGRCLLVLDDMVPTPRDIMWWLLSDLRRGRLRRAKGRIRSLLPSVRRAWPLQSDHIRVTEEELARWTSRCLRRTWRKWVRGYLTLEYLRVRV